MTTNRKSRAGYVIIPHRNATTYFTPASSYDRPHWVDLNEVAPYLTAEAAEMAVRKLWRGGSMTAKVVSLQEIAGLSMEMPDDNNDDREALDFDNEDDNNDTGDDEMVADRQEEVDDDEMRGVDPDADGIEDEFDEEGDIDGEEDLSDLDLDQETENEESLLGQHLKAHVGMESEETARLHPREVEMMGRKRVDMKESRETVAKLLRKGDDPAKPDENKTTAATMTDPKSKQFDFKDPVGTEDKPETDLNHAVSYEHEEKVNIPADIKSQLKDVIDACKKEAEANDGMNDGQGSFALTAGAALQQLLDDLELGNTYGIKQAQIHMTSYMSPIVNCIPPDVINFIARGGRKSSLKDIFGAKWDNKRGVEK